MSNALTYSVLWYRQQGQGLKALVRSIVIFVVLYGGAILENQVQVVSANGLWPANWGHAALVFIVVGLVNMILFVGRYLADKEQRVEAERRETLEYAASLAMQHFSRVSLDMMNKFRLASTNLAAAEAVFGNSARLQLIIEDAYQLFESRYGNSNLLDNRIDFEVTFITKSYKDGELTIPVFANRDRRAPMSMKKRELDNKVYNNTVAAELYRMEGQTPTLRIIESTQAEAYNELYAGQKHRIKSSLVNPVLSPTNEMLGALVVHCNRDGFFCGKDRKYWKEIMDRFSSRLAYEKLRLDILSSDASRRLFSLAPVDSF